MQYIQMWKLAVPIKQLVACVTQNLFSHQLVQTAGCISRIQQANSQQCNEEFRTFQ